ncbi:MAG: ATP-dependent zinc metalloprotease FtsH [Vulcanimicrobiota bacterium]
MTGAKKNMGWWYLALGLLLLWVWQGALLERTIQTLTYSQFKEHVRQSQVLECEIQSDQIVGKLKPEKPDDHPTLFRTIRVEDPNLVADLEKTGTRFVGTRPDVFVTFFLTWVLPLLLLVGLWSFLGRMASPGSALVGMGKSRARVVADRATGVTFADVAGCEEAKSELSEVVDFLQHPDRYRRLGAHIPKGVLLLGPPGTGKTLLARAVAGEARVPFYSLSGSEFVEMFVGVGASRVRDLFEQAKANAPCIVFIDELDAVGRERSVRIGSVNDEREQTLNQLLVEMDGFAPNAGVILLAATNRPEVLDRALLRPGRFDRRVVLDAPDLEGRLAILQVHSRGKPLSKEVDLRQLARSTPGFSGADLANAMNEAALIAARQRCTAIEQAHLEEAVEKTVAGPERKSRRLSESEKERVAYHESGHALVALHCPHADPVHKVSIVPRGLSALGYTLQLPREDSYLTTRCELVERLRVLLAGRAAEELVFGEVSTGAENDLERATALARQMVCLFGMSDTLGPGQCARRDSAFLNPDGTLARDCSEATAALVDLEVKSWLVEASREARHLLEQHRELLDKLAVRLLEVESIEQDELAEILRQT